MSKILSKKYEYSKFIVTSTGALFLLTVLIGLIFSCVGVDTSLFSYIIPATGGVFGASIIFYLNKAKLENILKIKISYAKFKIRLSELVDEETMLEIEEEFSSLEDSLNSKIDNSLSESIDSDIELTNY